jgi:hypothetical protein
MSEHSLDSHIVNDALASLLTAAAEAGARKALEQVRPEASRWAPLKRADLPYREVLRLVAAGELRTYGRGHSKYLDRVELDGWIESHPIVTSASAETDEISELIEATHARKAKRAKGAK